MVALSVGMNVFIMVGVVTFILFLMVTLFAVLDRAEDDG